MKQKLLLLVLFSASFANCFAEGQDGMGIFIFIVYAFAVLFYSFAGALLMKLVVKMFRIKDSTSFWFYVLISFIISLVLALIMGDSFLPM